MAARSVPAYGNVNGAVASSSSWAIHTQSLTSVLRPGTWAIWAALARIQAHGARGQGSPFSWAGVGRRPMQVYVSFAPNY